MKKYVESVNLISHQEVWRMFEGKKFVKSRKISRERKENFTRERERDKVQRERERILKGKVSRSPSSLSQ